MKFSLQLITSLGLLLSSLPLAAQSYTIGNFEYQNFANSYPSPYGGFREGMRAQFLYRAAELTAAGATQGNITGLSFNVESVTNVGVHENYTIKLMLTAVNTLPPGGWESDPSIMTVYGPVDYTPFVGTNQHDFIMPFYWDGASNLIVEICHSPTQSQGNSATNNAIVQLDSVTGFNCSRTYAVNGSTAQTVCDYTGSAEDGIRIRRPVINFDFCYPPVDLQVDAVTSITAGLSWSPPLVGSPAGYDWSFGLEGYVPGSAGIEIAGGSTTTPEASLIGLSGLTIYSFWVRSDCGAGYSRWAGPINFTTDPSCDDLFSDTGGPVSGYGTDEDYVKVLCPDEADNAISMSFFVPISIGAGDTLKLYNGNDTDAPLFAAISGTYGFGALPGPFKVTTASGCITAHFTSDEINGGGETGWIASLNCDPLPVDECYEVLQLDTANLGYTTVDLSWLDMFGADNYEYELIQLPATILHQDAAFTGTFINFNDLEDGTDYQFSVRTNCSNGENSNWVTILFSTPVNCNGPFIQCNQNNLVIAEQTGKWDILDCGISNPGREQFFRFVAPNTRSYNLEVISATGGYVSYLYKDASDGCNEDNWHCIDDFNIPGTSDLPPIPGSTLQAGKLYYILCDPQTIASVTQTFSIKECAPPTNDSPLDAIEIIVNTPCDENIYSNFGAGLDPDEPDPDVDDTDGLIGRWQDAADETVWFKFVAPASGTVTIFTNPQGSYLPNDDTQVALYQVGDPADYSTYQLLISDEDNGTAYLGFNSVVSYTGLNEGETYYIQVDGWGINSGAFCIAVIETVERIASADCLIDYSIDNVNQDKWYGIYATPDDLDIGPLVAAINPLGADLGTVTCRVQVYDEIPVSGNGIPYLPAYYYLTSSEPLVTPVKLRLFFTDSEFEDLKVAANEPDNTIHDLVVSRFNGVIADCQQLNNNGPSTLLTVNNAMPMVGSFYLDFFTDQLDEFGAHFGLVALPLELKYFTGKTLERSNLLEWVTLQEKDVQWHIVERSLSGGIWEEVGRVAGQAFSDVPMHYSLEDHLAPVSAYYRLRSVDQDGTASVSHAIHLTRKDTQFGFTSVYPSPVSDLLNVQFYVPSEGSARIRLTDVTGRLVLEESFESVKGINSRQLSLRDLAAGVYQLMIDDKTAVSAPVRIIKQ
ncbi:MAG: T9SS type A sorting domain-containing protein [Lewinellaceae bacterium]|nr:T9SS type A sorting domain-containing protein [Lewinellaceae bacterium]